MFRHRQSFGTPVGYVDANSWLFPTRTEVMNAGFTGVKKSHLQFTTTEMPPYCNWG